VLALAKPREEVRRLVFVEGVFVHLPNVEVILSHREQHGDVVLGNDVPLAELCVLAFAGNDARQVMAEHMADCILCVDELHTRMIPLFS